MPAVEGVGVVVIALQSPPIQYSSKVVLVHELFGHCLLLTYGCVLI